MPVIQDDEFGKITIRRSARSTQIRIRVAPDGSLRASMPLYAPTFLIKRLVRGSRKELREIIKHSYTAGEYAHGLLIGKSHSVVVKPAEGGEFSVRRHNQHIIIHLPEDMSLNEPEISRKITDVVISALRIEAKSYLPKRLSFLADKYGYSYKRVRFSHASGRWGSCSSNGTISLNIALMKLPFELIDYVIIHELTHTRHMNHSHDFWALVAKADPDYKHHKRLLKIETPSI